MVSFPNCKINIGLQVIGKRADGYHDLQTVFYPIYIKDALEIIDNDSAIDISFSATGLNIDGNIENNLCLKAYHLLKKDFPELPALSMHLHKIIPIGGGLGGGSADAVFTLQSINKQYSLALTASQLKNYAVRLGSDCAFFLINKPCFAGGRGDLLKEIPVDLSDYKILVVNPGININTSWAFSALKNKTAHPDLKDLVKTPVSEWPKNIHNDFEEPVFNLYPEINVLKENIYNAGATYASMSGSGSSIYGIFELDRIVNINFPAHYFYKWV